MKPEPNDLRRLKCEFFNPRTFTCRMIAQPCTKRVRDCIDVSFNGKEARCKFGLTRQILEDN